MTSVLSERPLEYAEQKTERGKVINPEYSIDRDQPTSWASPLRTNTLLCAPFGGYNRAATTTEPEIEQNICAVKVPPNFVVPRDRDWRNTGEQGCRLIFVVKRASLVVAVIGSVVQSFSAAYRQGEPVYTILRADSIADAIEHLRKRVDLNILRISIVNVA